MHRNFTLVLSGISALTEEVEAALMKACDDATLTVRSGRPFLVFTRTAPTMKDAILSAIDDVRKAVPGVDVLRVDHCSLVSQAEIARKIGRSRQLVHQYMVGQRGPGSFPAPVSEAGEGQSLWLWHEVASWLWENNFVKEDVLRDAEEVETINSVLDFERQKRDKPELIREVLQSVAVA